MLSYSDTEAVAMEEHLRGLLPRVAQRPVERLAPGYRKRTGAGGGGAERSMGWMSSTFERNHLSNS